MEADKPFSREASSVLILAEDLPMIGDSSAVDRGGMNERS